MADLRSLADLMRQSGTLPPVGLSDLTGYGTPPIGDVLRLQQAPQALTDVTGGLPPAGFVQDQSLNDLLSRIQLYKLPPTSRTMSDILSPQSMPLTGGTPAAGISPSNPADTFMRSIEGMRDIIDPSSSMGQRLGGVSALGREAMHSGTPFLLKGIARNPVPVLTGLGMGMGVSSESESALQRLGVHPGTAAFTGDLLGLAAGLSTAGLPWQNLSRITDPAILRNLWTDESGEIRIGPGIGWTSTLRDLVESKVPNRVSPQQLKSILQTAPKEEVAFNQAALTSPEKFLKKSEILGQLKQPQIEEVLLTGPDRGFMEDYSLPGSQDTQELLLRLPDNPAGSYTHRHWTSEFLPGNQNYSNVLGHIRYNDRWGSDNKRVRFLEELQSDWHQSGRKYAYDTPELLQKLEAARAASNDAYDEYMRKSYPQNPDDYDSAVANQAFQDYDRLVRIADKMQEKYNKRVPTAPFSKDWRELLFKRMLQDAVDNNFDRIAWTTGDQQVDRYPGIGAWDVRRLTYDPYEKTLRGYANENSSYHNYIEYNVAPEALKKHIGADLANRLNEEIKNYPVFREQDYSIIPNPNGQGYLVQGPGGFETYGRESFTAGLSLGGEPFHYASDARHAILNQIENHRYDSQRPQITTGLNSERVGEKVMAMREFYDVILPGFAREYAKKYGGTVGMSDILGEPANPATGTPAQYHRVHSMDITPQMYESVRERGQPMFGITQPTERNIRQPFLIRPEFLK